MRLSSRRSVLPLLRELHRRRWALFKRTTHPRALLIGTVYDVLRRCGNPSCRCAKKPTHRQTLFLSIHQGKRRCQFIRQEDLSWVRQAWEHYRECKKALQEIRALYRREGQLLRAQIKRRSVLYE